ncbi:MAG: PKD domain-containing protein, partial [Bacteroidota bacterium]
MGEHELIYIIQDGACTYGDQLDVDIVQSETMTTTEALALCENTAATPLNFSPVGGQWSGPGIIDAANGVFDPNTTGAGSFEVLYEYTDVNGCYLAKTSTVDVQALPIIQAPDTSIFCIESETIILAQELTPSAQPAGGNFSWSGTFIGDADNGTFNTPGEGTHPVQLSYSYELCTASTQLYVDISDPGEVVAGPDQSACLTEGEVRLIGSPVGGRWSGPGVIDPFGGVVDLNQIESGANEYVYTVADDSNCESSDVMQLELTGPGDLDAGIDLAFCADAGLQTLPVATPANGLWSGPHLTDATNGIINTDQLAVESDTWYTYTIVDEISGCVFSDSVAIHINEVPEVAFEVPAYQCVTDELRVEVPAQTGITYTWTVDESDTYEGNVLELTLLEGGNYPIQLAATNAAGCVGTAREELTIAEIPTPSFDLDSYEGCGPLTLDFADASVGMDIQYYWEFSNGVNSTDANPSGITFLPGVFDTTYQITLQVRNACGEAIYNDDVTVLAKPVADFGVPVNSGCGPLEINFANTTTGSADSYYWDFGNGNTSTEAIPQNQFYTTTDSTATVYDIMMVAYNTCGSDTITRPVTVEPANIVPFFNVSATEGCEPLTVDFTDYSNYGANVSWNFGDGTTSVLTDPTHTFDVAGYYTVYQYVTTACGTDSTTVNIEVLPGPDAAFSHPPVVCPDEEIKFVNESSEFLTIFWDFGDGNNSTEAEPTHQFNGPGTYPVTMVVSNADYLCQSSYSSSVTILERPTGYITTDAGSGCPPFDICLEAEFSDADFFEWTFGDSNTSTTLNPCHTFTEPGLYSVSFRAANELGCYSTYDTVKVRVYDEPLAEIATPQEVYCGENQTVNFVNNSSSNATSYEWHFSNGMTSTLSEPTVNFVGTGSYTAELIARNTFGCEDRDNTSFIIAPQPMADFAPITNDGCVPEMVIFDNASVNVTKYSWDFGNGETTEEEQPTTIYRNPGSYDVKLVVSYEDLCFDSLNLQGSINLLQKPTAAFSYEYPTDTYRGIVQFINESVDADTYRWDFSDGNTSSDVHPLHDIGRNGNWQTELVAIANNGCTDTAMVAFEPEVMYELFFPNALSPESGIGDVRVFKPAGIGLEDWTLEIFSPWGQRVYVSEEMEEDQPAAAWDGSYEGKILPQGAYSYKASVEFINGIRRVYTGSVTLIR